MFLGDLLLGKVIMPTGVSFYLLSAMVAIRASTISVQAASTGLQRQIRLIGMMHGTSTSVQAISLRKITTSPVITVCLCVLSEILPNNARIACV